VRPHQLKKLAEHKEVIAEISAKMEQNNSDNLAQIDAAYSETTELEAQFINKKQENMNTIIDSELLGIKFLHQFGANCRQEESLNSQINSIKHIIKMLKNEITLANTDKEGMDSVFNEE